MTSAASLASTVSYSGNSGSASWEGRLVSDPQLFSNFVRDVVRDRISDASSGFQAEVAGLASTGMSTEFIERFLKAVPKPEIWEIGEALAECALQHDSGRVVYLPWNTVRDRRTPRASLPGADLVGFFQEDDTVLLLIGEVKTSSDSNAPPNVMYGGSGMVWQLEASATKLDIQRALMKWLQSRCREAPYRELYESARNRYFASEGREFLLMGILIRDTKPDEGDLKARAKTLSESIGMPTRIDLVAWYLPILMTQWPKLLETEEAA